jgi:hypothetical protein
MITFGVGFAAGRRWAQAAAGTAELGRFCRARECLSDAWDLAIFAEGDDASVFKPAERLAYAIIAKHSPEAKDARDFWDRTVGKGNGGPADVEWLRGFIAGALEVTVAAVQPQPSAGPGPRADLSSPGRRQADRPTQTAASKIFSFSQRKKPTTIKDNCNNGDSKTVG